MIMNNRVRFDEIKRRGESINPKIPSHRCNNNFETQTAYIYKLAVTIKRCINKLTSVSIGLGVGDELSVCANIVVIDNSNDIETNKILVILCKIFIICCKDVRCCFL